MRYRIVLQHAEEGVAASVVGVPGCHSQGADEQEAMANIEIAIQEYWQAVELLSGEQEVREIEVEV
jgi:predicted RNase H-like HicB family nuclease